MLDGGKGMERDQFDESQVVMEHGDHGMFRLFTT
jgi:hypothetical protein